VKSQVLRRSLKAILLAVLWGVARQHDVYVGLEYALAMAALWLLLEVAIRMNPGMFNNPMVDDRGREQLMDLAPSIIGGVVAPVCMRASIASAVLGLAMTGLVAISPSTSKDIVVILVPVSPMMIGIPLYVILGRLSDLAASQARSQKKVTEHVRFPDR